jgi:hypothetical protein
MVVEASHSRLEACFAHVRRIMLRVVLSLSPDRFDVLPPARPPE